MTILIGTLVYLGVCIPLFPLPQAVTQAIFLGFSALAVTKLTRSSTVVRAFRWFAKYPFRGAFVLMLTASQFAMGAVKGGKFGQLAGASPLIFFWFWLFATLATFLAERRVQRLAAEPSHEQL